MNYLSLLNKELSLVDSLNFNNKFVYFNRNENLKHWNSYFDKKNNIRIMILGRPVIETSDWQNFQEYEQNYISKLLIKKYVNLDINEFCSQLNGAFSVLFIDYRFNKILIITDKLGIYPIYTYGADLEVFQFSSNFNFLVDNVSSKINVDLVSLAEFLKKGFIYHPNTQYKEIKTIDNGTYCILDFNKKIITKKKYFRFQAKPIYDFNYLVNKLSKALVKSIEKRTLKYFGKKVVFLSGGTDSRMILANSVDPKTEAVTLYNVENNETKLAKNISKSLNKKLYLIKRDDNYYYKSFNESIKINGGRCSPTDDHFFNLKNNEKIKNYDTILTGCYADWLFKGIALDRKQLSILGVKLPLYNLKNFDYDFFSKRTLLDKKYEKLIREREDNIFFDKKSHIENEICRIFPLFQEETAATRLTLQQLFPWDSIFSDNEILEVYQQIPAEYKINSEVYDKAVSLILNKVKNIPHSGKRHKIGINKYLGVLIYIIRVKIDKILNLLRIKKVNLITGDGSWMNAKKYVTDKEFQSLWMSIKKFRLFKNMLSNKKLDFKEILKNDTKLIFKCMVLDKFLSKKNKIKNR
ncbi:hypothetical protein [Candidatus Pelagibacter bacterium nBUS_28]|uniref:hypothetical protein n=1 Tax=Candidatus Pelagibacter bacterium nBUS_28 TaxID=3374189 RepID=UPI003EB8E9D4